MTTLMTLLEEMKSCSKCALRRGCTQVVPGEGSQEANVVFIGEAPGADEDEAGRPFVGRSGRFLREQMRLAGITEKQVLITNTCRCRPPDNREPNPDEIEACWPWTLNILQIIRPRVLVTLGRPALFTLANKLGFQKKIKNDPITKLAGKPIYVAERYFYVMPLLHPAFILRGADRRSEFTAHMRYLSQALPGWLERP